MKRNVLKKLVSTALAFGMLCSAVPLSASAASNDPVIVVSLGDSYSSGEGIPAFYGQEKAWEQRVYDEDWLAHRSTKSWPGLLEIPSVSGKMRDYNVKQTNSSKCKWYFGAVSGAQTKHFGQEKQRKDTYKRLSLFKTLKTTSYLPKQLDVFNQVSGDVDYVTLTIGGNDVGFADIITTCALNSTYLHFGSGKLKLEKQIDEIWAQFDTTRANIKNVYTDIRSKAGNQANILVAGYPKLLDKDGKGVLISEKEASIVNENVTKFNNQIAGIVNECKGMGLNIYFVDVEAEFDKDGGHQAYSDNAWINKIILTKQDQDLDQSGFVSDYSIHPNEDGAKAYARCMNAMIREIESRKTNRNAGTSILKAASVPNVSVADVDNDTLCSAAVSGRIVDAADETTTIADAVVNVYKDDELVLTTITNAEGEYAFELEEGDYRLEVQAKGFADFTTEFSIHELAETILETVLLNAVPTDEDEVEAAEPEIIHALMLVKTS